MTDILALQNKGCAHERCMCRARAHARVRGCEECEVHGCSACPAECGGRVGTTERGGGEKKECLKITKKRARQCKQAALIRKAEKAM